MKQHNGANVPQRGMPWNGLSMLAVGVAGLLSSSCDTRCVGPDCPGVVDTFDSGAPPVSAPGTGLPPGDADERAPFPTTRSCEVTWEHAPPAGVRTVEVAGSFNGWEPAALAGPTDEGWYVAELGELAPGTYAYKYVYDGQYEGAVPLSADLAWDGGVENRALHVGDCTRPLTRVEQAGATPNGSVEVLVRYALGADGAALREGSVSATAGTTPAEVRIDTRSQTIAVSADGLPPGKHSVRLTFTDAADRTPEDEVFVPLWVEDEPFSWTDGAMYLLFVDRFRDGDGEAQPIDGAAYRANYTGGDLLGVLHALEEGWFTDLGIRSIWLSPLYENPEASFAGQADANRYTGYHGYWPTEPRAVESRYGDDDADAATRLHQVVAAAHAQGIRILMDAVLNHVHEDHVYRTQYPDWFGPGCVCGTPDCSWEDKPIECMFTSYMPDLDHTNPEIVDVMVEDTLWWVRTFDLDGVRIDAVKHMHRAMTVNLSHALRDRVERGGAAQVYQVGETFTGADGRGQLTERIGPEEMDGQFDFPLYWTTRDVFAYGASFQALEDATRAGLDTWGDAPMSPFAGNHDVGRLATAIAGTYGEGFDQGPWGDSPDLAAGSDPQPDLLGRVHLALAYVLTQPGVPLLYYGDEIALAGSGDPDNRRRMSFEPSLSANQRSLLSRVQAVGRARAASPALQRGAWTPLWAEQDLTVYARHTDDELAVVLLHRGGDRTVTIPMQGLAPDGTLLRDLLTDGRSSTVEGGSIRVPLTGADVAILGTQDR